MDIIVEKGDKTEVYHSRIEDITKSNLIIAMPMIKGCPIFLYPDDIFYGKVIDDHCVFKFELRYIDKKFTPLPVWITTIPTEFSKIQQREFVRVGAFIDSSVEVLDKDEDMKVISEIKATTRDISGGGVQVTSHEPIALGSIVKLSFLIPEGALTATCEVVRSSFQAEAEVYWTGLKYLNINEADRSKLIRYIFHLQIEKKRRE